MRKKGISLVIAIALTLGQIPITAYGKDITEDYKLIKEYNPAYEEYLKKMESGEEEMINMPSPYIIDGKSIKYIDYDLDLRVFPDGSFKVLDRGEYKYHKSIMNYPEKVDIILKEELTNLINQVRNKEGIFSPGVVEEYSKIYKENEV